MKHKVILIFIEIVLIVLFFPVPGNHDMVAPININIQFYKGDQSKSIDNLEVEIITSGWFINADCSDGCALSHSGSSHMNKVLKINWMAHYTSLIFGPPDLNIKAIFIHDKYKCSTDFKFPNDKNYLNGVKVIFSESVTLDNECLISDAVKNHRGIYNSESPRRVVVPNTGSFGVTGR